MESRQLKIESWIAEERERLSRLFSLLVLVILVSCVTSVPAQVSIPNDWHKVNAGGYFIFYLPRSIQFKSAVRCEECAWGSRFADKRISLYAEYTSWNEEYAAHYLAKQSEYLKTVTEIAGRRVKIQSWRSQELPRGYKYIAEARFYAANGNLIARLSADCKDRADVDVAKQIFMTVAAFKP